jgi:hydrogenase expression/formation protein HypC
VIAAHSGGVARVERVERVEEADMCLAVPGRLVDVFVEDTIRMGHVNFEGVVRQVCLECVPDAAPGDYVLVHVGFALSRIDEAEARRVFELLKELAPLEERVDLDEGRP